MIGFQANTLLIVAYPLHMGACPNLVNKVRSPRPLGNQIETVDYSDLGTAIKQALHIDRII